MAPSSPNAHHVVDTCLPDGSDIWSRHWGWQCFTCSAHAEDVGSEADARAAAEAHIEIIRIPIDEMSDDAMVNWILASMGLDSGEASRG